MTVVSVRTSPDLGGDNAQTKSLRTKLGISTCEQIVLTSLNELNIGITLISCRHICFVFCSGFVGDCLPLCILILLMGKDKDLSSDTCLKQTVTNEDLNHTVFRDITG